MGTPQPQIPATARVIHVDTPWTTPREFARRTGLSESAVRAMIFRGELPIIKPTGKKMGSIMINMMKLAEDALAREL